MDFWKCKAVDFLLFLRIANLPIICQSWNSTKNVTEKSTISLSARFFPKLCDKVTSSPISGIYLSIYQALFW